MLPPQLAEPNWLLEILKIAVPVVLGALVWAGQTLAQRAWTEYERRRDAYADIVRLVDSLFDKGPKDDRQEYLRAVRKVWLVGSDDVVRAINRLSNATQQAMTPEQRDADYRNCLLTMRKDLRVRRWLPPRGTDLQQIDFPIQGPGDGA